MYPFTRNYQESIKTLHIDKSFTIHLTILKIVKALENAPFHGFNDSALQSFAQTAMKKGSVKIVINSRWMY